MSVIIACGFAHERRWLTGQVLTCPDCGRAIYLTDDTRRHVERQGQEWVAVCIPCASDKSGPDDSLEVTPLARLLGNAAAQRRN